MKYIIWGYPHYSDTFSYVWYGFNRAFKALGHEVHWLPDKPVDPENPLFKDAVFLCEGYQDKHIPINKTSTYINHVCINPEKYLNDAKRLIDLRYYCDSQNHEKNYKYVMDRHSLIKIGPLAYYSGTAPEYEKIYLAWATDLLPEEINLSDASSQKSNNIYFIGSMYGDKYTNGPEIEKVKRWCERNSKQFVHIDPWANPVTHEENRRLIRESYLAPDVRGRENIDCGYIPCRIFKNISYGQLGLTNSRAVHAALEEYTFYHPDMEALLDIGETHRFNRSRVEEQMEYVRENHTYINRAKAILEIL